MAWSKYQNKIFEYSSNPDNGSFVISAGAGCGKTTTLVECAKRLSADNPLYNILFLAFNKAIVDKLKTETASPNMKCATLHSFGLSVLYKSKMKFVVNEYKWKTYLKKNCDKLLVTEDKEILASEKKKYIFQKNCDELLRLCRINMIEAGNKAAVEDIAFRYRISPIANEIDAVTDKLLKASKNLFNFKTKAGIEIDYTDMLCWPMMDSFRKYIFKYDVVFIDEAQDLSLIQQMLMLETVKKDGKFIACGDRAQSINGFSGSLTDSFQRLFDITGKELPLTVNYRCGRRIIEEAQTIVKELQPYEEAIEGEVVHQKTLAGVKEGDMVICRKTAPLVTIALNMMSNEISCFIKGADICEDMKNMVERAYDEKDDNFTKNKLCAKLDDMVHRTVVDLLDRNIKNPYVHPTYISVAGNVEAIKIVAQYCTEAGDVVSMLDKIFDDTKTGHAVMLSTVHKAKGLEADNVYIVCPELLPMKYEGQQQWEYEQEMNLKYVAITRAKQKLVFVDCEEKDVDSLKFF